VKNKSNFWNIYQTCSQALIMKAALEWSEQNGEGRSFGGEPEGTKDAVQV
jgi:hypothetical protein